MFSLLFSGLFTSIGSFFSQFKIYVYIAILMAFLGLFAHDRYLSHIIDKKEQEIIVLNKNISDLKSSIDLQNASIKNMNADFEKQIADFKLKEEEIKKQNKKDLDYIKKQATYTRPKGMNECEATKKVLSDYIDDRDNK